MKDVTNVFSSRLRDLRGDRNQDDVAKELGISRASLSYYESGVRKPDINTLYALAKYYNVSSDYLLGLSDASTPDIDFQAIVNKTGLSETSVRNLISFKDASSQNYNPAHQDYQIYCFLGIEVINQILNPRNDLLLDNLVNYFFVHFTHFSNIHCEPDNKDKMPDLALHDHFLHLTYSEDYDFFSNAFLLQVQKELQAARNYMTIKIEEFFHDYTDQSMPYNELHELFIDFFHTINSTTYFD